MTGDEEAGDVRSNDASGMNAINMNTIGQSMSAPQQSSELTGISTTEPGAIDAAQIEGEQMQSKQEDESSNPRKEKSVLQAKLTKLAIQIGYGGLILLFLYFEPQLVIDSTFACNRKRLSDRSADCRNLDLTFCDQKICHSE